MFGNARAFDLGTIKKFPSAIGSQKRSPLLYTLMPSSLEVWFHDAHQTRPRRRVEIPCLGLGLGHPHVSV